ncbi:mitochondrial substrate carrier family protein C [Acrasis kona]|uniref:Mitochondrial substrate carrier family protein C n=1 Tax=Acrasis kona TaxID=1008807 RepID=A0AAW2ZSW9_9EUKA
MTEEEKQEQELKLLFDALDTNKDKKLIPEEVRTYLKTLKLPCTNTHVKNIMDAVDLDHDGFITFEELKAFASRNTKDLRKLFDEIDTNKDGKLTIDEVREALPRLHIHPYTQDQLARMMKQVDKDLDGTISFDEWRTLLCLIPASNIEVLFQYWQEAAVIDDTPEGLMLATSMPLAPSTTPFMDSIKVFAAGGISGAASRTITAPLERLKIMYQVSTEKPPSVIRGLEQMYRNDGISGLFRGNLTNVLKVVPEKSLKFLSFEFSKNLLTMTASQADQELSATKLFVAGSMSGVITHTITFPMEVIRTRLSVAPKSHYAGIVDCARKIAVAEGRVRPFFRGLSASLVSTIPYSGINLMSYELMKKALYAASGDKDPTIASLMVVGSASNTASQMFFYPLTVAKSRIIMQGHDHSQKKGLVAVLSDIYKVEGTRGLFKGFVPQLLKSAPSHAIMFGVYEQCKRWFGLKDSHHKKH